MSKLKKRRYIALGNLVVDRVLDDFGYEILVDGGGNKYNVLSRLAYNGEQAVAYSQCGKDRYGYIAIESLKKYGVDVSKIKQTDSKTRVYELRKVKKNYVSKKLNFNMKNQMILNQDVINQIKDTDVILFDNLSQFDINTINTFPNNNKVLDLGKKSMIENKKIDELSNDINKKFEIIQLPEIVEKELKANGIKNDKEIYLLFSPKILIVTRGKKGATFIYKDMVYNETIENPAFEVDSTGAGDAFLATFVEEYYNRIINSKELINKQFIDDTFKKATTVTSKVVSYNGARGDLKNIIRLKEMKNKKLDKSKERDFKDNGCK